MLNHLHYLDSGRDGRRPLTFSRYAGLGSHRYPVGFSGDAIITWDSLDFQPYFTATAANAGYTWWSHDIGGHMWGAKDVELTVRWCQFGALSPVNRLHSSNSPFTTKEPWTFGPRAFGVISRFMRLRHRLIPALYTAAWRAHTDAVAVVRPMYHDHPLAGEAYSVPNQYLLGEHLIVAPITAPEDRVAKLGAVRAWLPDGAWFDAFTGQRYDGGRHLTLHRSLERVPVLARAGSVLPLADALAPVVDAPERLTLRVFPGDGVSHLAEDHGEGNPAAPNVTRFVQALSLRDDGLADLRLTIEPTTGPDPLAGREIALEIVGADAVDQIEVISAQAERTGSVPDPSTATPEVVADELLSPALRVELGRVSSDGAVVVLTGLRAAEPDLVGDAFGLLDAAEIAFTTKEAAWSAVKRLDGLALAQELTTLDLPPVLRDALLERAAATTAW
jgi:hypothetical protein